MRKILTIAALLFSLSGSGQMQMLFSSDSLVGITSPLAIDSLFYWFAADQGVLDSLGGAIANNEGVGTWQDLSGNGRHVTSTSPASPVWKATGGPGSKPCIQFDGSDDFLAEATATWWGSDDMTIIVVLKNANATLNSQEQYVNKFNNSGSELNRRQWTFFGENTINSYVLKYNAYEAGDASLNRISTYSSKSVAWRALSTVKPLTGNVTAWVDNVSSTVTTAASPADAINNYILKLGIGANNVTSGTPGSFLNGSITEIIVYSKALTATERAAIENYLNKKYDLY